MVIKIIPLGLHTFLILLMTNLQSCTCSSISVDITISKLSFPNTFTTFSALQITSTPEPRSMSTPIYSDGFHDSMMERRPPLTLFDPISITRLLLISFSYKLIAPNVIQFTSHIVISSFYFLILTITLCVLTRSWGLAGVFMFAEIL